MGRGKTRLIKIEDDDSSSKSYSRRNANLVKKSFEMGTLSGVDVALIFFSKEGKLTHFSMHSRSIANVVAKFINLPQEKRGMYIENPGYLLEILKKINFDDARALLQQPVVSNSDVKAKIKELQMALNAKERKRQESLQRLRFFMPVRNAPTTSAFEECRKETILTVLAQVKERKMKLIQQGTAAAPQQECTGTTTSLQQQFYQQAPPQQGYYASTAPVLQQRNVVAPSPQICYNTAAPQQRQQYCNAALPQQYCAPSSLWQQTIPRLQQHYSPSIAAPQQDSYQVSAPPKQEPIAAPPRYYNPTAPFQQKYCTSAGTPDRHRTIAPLQQQHSMNAPPQDNYHVPAPAKQEDNVVPIQAPECTTFNISNDTMPPRAHFEQQSTDVHQNNPSTVQQRNPDDNDVGSTLPRDTVAEVMPPFLDPDLPLDLENALNRIVKDLWQDDSVVPFDFNINSFVDQFLKDVPDDADDPDVP